MTTAAARFAGQLVAGRRIEPKGLDEQRQVGGPAGSRHLGHEPLLGCGVRRLVVVVDEQLGRRGTQALGLLDGPAGQHPADPCRRWSLVPGGLDRDEKARSAGQ